MGRVMKQGDMVAAENLAGTAADATHDRIRARMAWLDDQDAAFRALVYEHGLKRACVMDGRRPLE